MRPFFLVVPNHPQIIPDHLLLSEILSGRPQNGTIDLNLPCSFQIIAYLFQSFSIAPDLFQVSLIFTSDL